MGRRPLRPAVAQLAWLLPLLLLAGACKRREPAAPPTLVVAGGSDFDGPNELVDAGARQNEQEIRGALFLHLLRERPDYQDHPPTFAPELARAWRFSADRLTLSFELRDDARWSDGAALTAEDVRFTWQAQTSPEVGWTAAYLKERIREVEVVGPKTVRFHFTSSYPGQLLDANEGFILPRHVWGKLPFARWGESADWFAENLVVSGPFTLRSWRRGEELVLARNPRYYRPGRPRIERVVFRVVPEEATRIQDLLAGNAHVVEAVPPDRVDEVEGDPDSRVAALWARQYTFIAWNTRRPPFDDAQVRRALTLAIDRAALVETLWRGHARVAVSPIPASVWAHLAELRPWPYDPRAARRLLAERGFRDGDGDGIVERNGQPFSFELSTTSTSQLRRDAVVLIQEQLRRVGVEARPAFREPGTQLARLDAHEFDGALSAFGIDTGLDMRHAFHSGQAGDSNWGRYADPEVDRLLDRIATQTEPRRALPLYHQLQRLLHRDQPYTFLWEPQSLVGLAEGLQGSPSPLRTLEGLDEWRFR
jgi:peptide/nickel transport system substrate-binding protein